MAHDLTRPLIKRIGVSDLKEALLKGLQDFNEKPSHLIFLGIFTAGLLRIDRNWRALPRYR
jgi:uncharacterized membrane protein